MAKKAKNNNNNKNLIIGICTAVLVIVIIVVAVVFAIKGNSQINDAYFVSDGSKYVLTLGEDMMNFEDTEYTPIKTHIVYKYSGDQITDMTTYLEFANEATAKAALPIYEEIYGAPDYGNHGIKSISATGKYLAITSTEDQYSGITTSDVEQQIELIEKMKNGNLNTGETEDTVEK